MSYHGPSVSGVYAAVFLKPITESASGLTFWQPLFAELCKLQSDVDKPVLQVQRREAERQQSTWKNMI